MISNYPGMKIKPGSMGKPFPGITATVVDLNTHVPLTKAGTVGLIAIRPGWPSMFRTYWRNEATYQSKFKNGWYICGDRASLDEEGYFWFVGRDDDVINTAGHLVGPFEIESALLEHEAVAESAVVGKPDPVNMEVVKAFITLKPGHAAFQDARAGHHELRAQEALAPGHAPGDRVHVLPAQDTLGQDHAPRAARQGVGPGHRRHLDSGERLVPITMSALATGRSELQQRALFAADRLVPVALFVKTDKLDRIPLLIALDLEPEGRNSLQNERIL